MRRVCDGGGETRHGRGLFGVRPFASAAILAAIPTVAVAQAVPPGSVARPPTAEELQRAPLAPPVAPQVSVRSRGVVAGPCPEAIANSPLRVGLRQVVFAGPGGAELQPQVRAALAGVGAGLTGAERPLADICAVRDEATAALSRARFVGVVQVPEQTLADGVLRLTVITARITELRVIGTPGASADHLATLLERLRGLDPLNEADAERILLLANDVPGTSVRLELRSNPNGRPGEVIGEIGIDRAPGALLFNVQNTGSQQIGRWSGLVRGELYGLTGLADRTVLSVFSTSDFSEQQVVQAGHDFAIGTSGLRLGGSVTHAWTSPTLPNAAQGLDLKSRSLLASLQATYPLVRTVSTNARVGGGLELLNQRTRANGQPISEDRLRTLFLRLEADVQERSALRGAPAWRFGAGIEGRQGIGILNGSRQGEITGSAFPTRLEGDPRAFVLRGNLAAEGRARFGPASPYAVTVAADVRGQYTDQPLLAFDEFAVGNLTLGRGYDPGATSGDRAIGAAFELRAGKPAVLSRDDIALEAFGFYDVVRIRNLDTNNFERDRELESVGGGIRATWGSRARLDLTYARPLDRALEIDTARAPARVLLSLTIRAFPWR